MLIATKVAYRAQGERLYIFEQVKTATQEYGA
jgi:hypothetical protein